MATGKQRHSCGKHVRRRDGGALGRRYWQTAAGKVIASMLLFKKKFLEAIRSGEKTQTIRLWKFRHMRTGQRSYIPGVGPIHVTLVEPVEIDALTDDDAIPDGFASANALQQELRTIYGDKIASGHKAFRIAFERVDS
jgi:hypothetical protein